MKTLLIVSAILALLALMPLGAHVRYDAEGPVVALTVGPFRLRLVPKKAKKPQKPKEEKKEEDKPKKKEKQPAGARLQDFYPFVKLGLELIGCFLRKLRVPLLTLHVGFGGADDPAAAAINYGRAWSAIGAIMQPIRSATRIRKENVSCSCDFTSGQMRIFAEMKAVFLLGDLAAMAVRYGIRALRLYLRMKKNRKQRNL